MKSIKNYIQLLGNVSSDVELIAFDSGSKKASFSFATSEGYKKGEEFIKKTLWHQIVAWNSKAEALHQTIQKGDTLIIHGSINYREYENKDGHKKRITEILLDGYFKTKKDSSTQHSDEIPTALNK